VKQDGSQTVSDKLPPEEEELGQFLMDWSRRHGRRYMCAFEARDGRIVVVRDPGTNVPALLKIIAQEDPNETSVHHNRNIQ
jgi:hypothetical protein